MTADDGDDFRGVGGTEVTQREWQLSSVTRFRIMLISWAELYFARSLWIDQQKEAANSRRWDQTLHGKVQQQN